MFRIVSMRSAALALALLGSAACGAAESELCNQYIACVGASSPTALSETINVYGRDGSCWRSLARGVCEQICRDGLTALRKLPNPPAACKEPAGGDTQGGGQDPMQTADPSQPQYAWPFGNKSMFYSGPYTQLPLGMVDPDSGEWGCRRDDQSASPPPSIARMMEPNDEPMSAVSLVNPLPEDLPPSNLGSTYEICPDRSKPQRPDYDSFKFRLSSPSRVVAELRYLVQNGDLDLALFRLDVNPDTGKPTPTRIAIDDSAVGNACVHQQLGPGTYYVVVRGAPQIESGAYATAMNVYNLKVYVTTSPAPNPCERRA